MISQTVKEYLAFLFLTEQLLQHLIEISSFVEQSVSEFTAWLVEDVKV